MDHYEVESFGRMGDLSGEEASNRSWRAAKGEETRRHGERDCALWVGLSFFLSFFLRCERGNGSTACVCVCVCVRARVCPQFGDGQLNEEQVSRGSFGWLLLLLCM